MTPTTIGKQTSRIARWRVCWSCWRTTFVAWGLTVLLSPAVRPAAIPTALRHAVDSDFQLVSGGSHPGRRGATVALGDTDCRLSSSSSGGAVFDVFATVIHSPSLIQEFNPVARLLLDSGHSTGFVYAYGGFCQIAFATLVCLLWAGFLRHRQSIVNSVRESTSLMQLLKALNWRSRIDLAPVAVSVEDIRIPDFSYYVWVFTAMSVCRSGVPLVPRP